MEADQADSPGDSKPPLELTTELSRFIENMGLHYENYGVPRIGGRILGLLLVAQEPLAPEQIAETLLISRSSVSTNLRMLLMTEMVEKIALPGERCDFFVFSPDTWNRSLQIRMESILDLRELAEQGISALDSADPAHQKLQDLAAWVDFMEKGYAQLQLRWQSQNKIPA